MINVSTELIADLRAAVKSNGLRATARTAGVSVNTIKRALDGGALSDRTVAALRRVPPRVRTAGDFAVAARVQPPRTRGTATSWSLESIRAAIDQQMRGQFALPVRLAETMRRDDAIFVARSNRLAPVRSVATSLRAHDSDRGRAIAARAKTSVQVPRTVLASIASTLIDHAVAIGYVEHEPDADGTRIDMRLTSWPLEHVRYNETTGLLETATAEGVTVPITHGDGRWIVFRRFSAVPWREEACLLPAAFVWASHAEGVADWSASSRAHGLAKIVGQMPEGSAINDAEGNLTPAAAYFIDLLRALAEGEESAGLTPAGSTTQFLSNGSTAWQVFESNIVSREKAAARIYLGTDATLGSIGGAPGVDISQLFGVASTKTQDDFDTFEVGFLSGLYEPWAAINYGDTRYAPALRFEMPDPDADRKRGERYSNRTRLTDTIKAMREQRLEVTQDTVDALAREYGVEPAPKLAALEQQATTVVLAPTDVAKVVRVREARSAQGLPPFGDARDDMTISQLDAWVTTQAAAQAQQPAT